MGDEFDQSGEGAAFVNDRPNLNPGRTTDNITIGKLNEWFDPTAFSLPPVGELGNSGRNFLIGPGFWNIDFSAIKNTAIKENLNLQFRAEFFNIFNHSNWGLPNAAAFSQGATPLIPGLPCENGGCISPTAGQITTIAAPMRQIQFALKLIF
ncbi:MAG TPA: hypothetical protein VLY24_17460 [Bryobacteraceae bacterium]|nr:hypothetical protein [Bryobacteraceae bacterium]